jgi:alpha,alpha-trehalose phosphorylase
VVQSQLIANESIPMASKDPRAAAALAAPLESESYDSSGYRAILVHRTRPADC